MNPGRMYGRICKAMVETGKPPEVFTMATENELLAILLAGVGFTLAVMDNVARMGGPSRNEQIAIMLRSPEYPGGVPDLVGAREKARKQTRAEGVAEAARQGVVRSPGQRAFRGPQESQDGAGGGKEG